MKNNFKVLNITGIYFSLSIYFIFFYIASRSAFSNFAIAAISEKYFSLDKLFIVLYLVLIALLLFYSIKYKATQKFYWFHLVSSLLGIYFLFSFACYIYFIVKIFYFNEDNNQYSMKTVIK